MKQRGHLTGSRQPRTPCPQVIPHPRRSDCPGSFHSPRSMGICEAVSVIDGFENVSRTSLCRGNLGIQSSFVRQTFYADTESPIGTISYLQPYMFDFQGSC
jgi:hypothetical protein